ncbi:WxL domain-containing protein [Exiguobacterium sp. SL-9]|uniref:WxL domain-containing protein n=1 Tax=Exiguobacterium sp. SL-9 TaxID=2510963 RepID=UPI00103ED924|nr:WxL domain-containing protein [Exiguobacterium sp. SL-9]TCI22587.1 WxL domain-containing protein [Exiguobacterium sp. SL-9]
MFSKQMKVGILASVIAISSLTSYDVAQADPLVRSTNATITFETLEVPDILDPLNPDTPKDPGPDEGELNQEAAELTLDFAPNLYFGSHEIKEDGSYTYPALVNANQTANPDEKTSDPFLQVTDRQVVPGNWEVTVEASRFTNSETANADSLAGATLTFTDGVLDKPTANVTAISPTLISPVEVRTGEGAQVLLTAGLGQGQFSWIAHWIPENSEDTTGISLTVPVGSIQKGTHTSTLTWTLATTVLP